VAKLTSKRANGVTIVFLDLPPHAKVPKLPEFPPRVNLPEAPALPPTSLTTRFDMDKASSVFDPLAIHRKLLSQKVAAAAATAGANPIALGGGTPGAAAPSPSLYEMAALTQELDTQAVTTKVKEILLANNVGQKVSKPRYNAKSM